MSKTYIHKSNDEWAGEYDVTKHDMGEGGCEPCAWYHPKNEYRPCWDIPCPGVLHRILPVSPGNSVNTDKPKTHILPTDGKLRKTYPIYSGFVAYFPDAIACVSRVSWEGNEQHHPGTPLHWDKSKSSDESDAMLRHLIEGELDKVAWRALALLQRAIEAGWRPATAQGKAE